MQAPDVDVVTINRKNRDRFVDEIRRKRGDVFLCHWDGMRLLPELRRFEFGTIIGDEVHRIVDRKSITTRSMLKLRADHKLGMSGTAAGDQPHQLWSILNWLYPTYFRSYWKFRKRHCIEEVQYSKGSPNGYTKITGVQHIDELMELIGPWYVRHLKREQCCKHHPDGVMPWLPDKTYSTIWVDLNTKQRRFYEQMRREMVAWVNEHEDTPLVANIVISQLVRLSQMALATPEIVGTKWVWRNRKNKETGEIEKVQVEVDDVRLSEPSSKLDAALELFKDHPNKQFVVFSSSKQMVNLAQAKFAKRGISSFVLSGDTPQHQRDGMVKRFVNGDTQVFIGVIDAAGEGIDGLQHATDTAVFLDRSWKTIKNKQAEDRLHRGGQKDTVQIIDIMARDTVDLGRKQRLEEKWSWIRSMLGDGFQVQELKE